jgi:hypothetical protein
MEFLREAGFCVYPLLACGVLSARWAALYARGREPEQRLRWLALMGLTLAFGALGTVTGLQASVVYITTTPDKWLFLVGLRESLNNGALALGFVILDLVLLLAVPRRAQPALEIESTQTAERPPTTARS